jgi:hypothetical protein
VSKYSPPTYFKARNMPVTLLRIGSAAEFPAPGWTRLQKHIERTEKAGGWVNVERRRLPKPINVEGYTCVEVADVELAETLV